MSKSSHHREENTFKFETFSERLAGINVDVARKIQRVATTPEDAETFFVEALAKWTELNCTQDFTSFRRELTVKIQTLAQVVHHQNDIVEVLQRHLRVSKSLALQPLLDLVVQLGRDLQGDFYSYFPSFFELIATLLNTHHHDVDILEQAFSCLAYLFKFLWRTMVKDMHNVYRLFSPLLSSKYRSYINTFAAESFAFLIRKVKNHSELLDFLFSTLKNEADQTAGLGRLLFEAIKGVQKQFHSASETILPVLLEKLGSRKLPRDSVCEVLLETWHCMAQHTSPQYAGPVWTVMLNRVEMSFEGCQKVKKKDAALQLDELFYTLQLVQNWLSYKQGLLLRDPDSLVQVLLKLMKGPSIPEHVGDLVLCLASDVLLSKKCNISPHLRPKLLQQAYDTKYTHEMLYSFSRKIFNLPLYEKDALPCLLHYLRSCVLGEVPGEGQVASCLHILAMLLTQKAPQPTDVNHLEQYQIYLLDFSSSIKRTKSIQNLGGCVEERLAQALDELPSDQDLAILWAALVCLPHLKPLDEKQCANHLKQLMPKILKYTETEIHDTTKESYLFVFGAALFSMQQLVSKQELFNMVPLQLVMRSVKQNPSSVPCLRAAALYLSAATKQSHIAESLNDENFRELFPFLQDNLSSPYRQVRLLTLQICVNFTLEMCQLPPDVEVDQVGVFRICLDAEQVELDVHAIRDKLRYLQKLECSAVQHQLPVGSYAQVPLCYLVGMLYVNFKLLWEPVSGLIKGHAVNLGRDEFWSLFSKHLESAASLAEKSLLREGKKLALDRSVNETTVDEDDSQQSMVTLFTSHQRASLCHTDRPDHVNFRHLLWRAMQGFPDVCEARSRILVPLFFRFLRNEYYPTDLNAAPSQDISQTIEDVTNQEDPAENSAVNESELEENTDDITKVEAGKRTRRAAAKTLLVHLTIFSKFKNPRVLYEESKLRALYDDLLLHGNSFVHKMAFDCIMTYNYKFLVPYKENFERLLHDGSFKDEIVLFSLDEQVSVVKTEHREGLLPILMRILYGKMQGKTGKDTAGKNHSQLRKNIVLRFLAGCKGAELAVFLDLIFEPLKHFLSDNLCGKIKYVTQSIDLHSVFPLRRQLGMLETTSVVLKRLGNVIETYLPTLLHITTCLLAQAQYLLNQERVGVHPKAIPMLKAIRQTCYARMNQFFDSFLHYPLSKSDIDGIFEAAVWPQIEKLPHEGLYHPTGLLRLLNTWSEHKRYLPLLGKIKAAECDVTPLPYVFQLLHANSVNSKVVSAIMEMVENLLTEEEMDEELESDSATQPLDVGQLIESLQADESRPLGVSLLLPHVPAVLLHLKAVVAGLANHHGKIRKLPLKPLGILSRLSFFVSDGQQSKELVELLLSFLGRNIRRTEDAEVNILDTVANLIKLVDNPAHSLDSLSKLFCCVSARASRTGLCKVVRAIAEKDPAVGRIATLVTKLNAWDPRYVEEPDYTARLSAFQEAQAWIKEDSLPACSILKMLLYNCCHFINTAADIALRDSSSYLLQDLVQRIAALDCDTGVYQPIICQALLAELKAGLKGQTEECRLEYISLLSQLVKNFPDRPIFCDLTQLKDPDPETDFFSNMVHIQVHRRARAMRRLAKVLDSRKLNVNTLVLYLMPMVSAYLRDEAYAKQQNLLDAAIEASGAICRCLPWERYQLLLKHYLTALPKSLTNQRLMVRLVVTVLDAFHFDLRNSTLLNKSAATFSGNAGDGGGNRGDKEKLNAISDVSDDIQFSEKNEESEKEVGNEGMTRDEENKVVEEEHLGCLEGDTDVNVASAGMQICPAGLATRIHQVIMDKILPDLHKLLTKKSKSDEEHKAAKQGKYAEDEEVLRVPIALAVVKLLKNLPHKTLENNLPNVLLKVCQFLKSRAQDVRESSRDTLLKIMQTLGVKHLGYVLKELRGALTRGYQLHVLGFTVHALLTSLVPSLTPGDLDRCTPVIVQVCNGEIFGTVAEEKEVEGIRGKLVEARSTKSYDSYAVLARYVTAPSLILIMQPQQEILSSTHSHKVALKVQEVLSKVSFGLVENTGLELHALLTFIYGLATDALPLLNPKQKNIQKKQQHPGMPPPSVYLLQPPPARGGKKPKTQAKTNMYIIVEFGLQLLHMMLKKSRVNSGQMEHLQLLDPFIPVLTSSLAAKHMKVTSTALRCLTWLLKFPLPSLKDYTTNITDSLFVLLSTYAAPGAKGDNFELVFSCFKAMTVLVRDVTYHSMSMDQLQVLLQYAEQDIHDHSRQATAFNLLKAILSRKLAVPEMGDVIEKVEQLSITSQSAHVRLQSRQVALQFMLDYPLGKQVYKHLEFYIMQLDYEHESGRESALEMMATIFSTFPQGELKKNASFFFVPLASRLVNDESAKCRKLAALAIKSLLSKLETDLRDELFAICIEWFKDHKVILHRLAALACGLVVEVESTKFERHLKTIMPLIELLIKPENFDKDMDQAKERDQDHLLFAGLNLLVKILRECPGAPRKKPGLFCHIFEHVASHLLYPHVWVRLASAQLFGLLFTAWKPQDLLQAADSHKQDYLLHNQQEKIHDLCGAFTKQLASPQLDEELAEQIIKNLVFLGKVLKLCPDEGGEPQVEKSDDAPKQTTLSWLVRRLVRLAKTEASTTSKVTIKRISIFKWMAAASLDLGRDLLPQYLSAMMPSLVIEATNTSATADPEMKSLSQEVLDLMKQTVGMELFNTEYSIVHKSRTKKKEDRKRQQAQDVMLDPESAARKRMKKTLQKKNAKKRKAEDFRPSKKLKTKKYAQFSMSSS